SGRVDERTERFRRELAEGLGPFARRLPELAHELARRAAAPADRDPIGPPLGEFSSAEYVLDDLELSAGGRQDGPDDIGP
ncbi:MAG: hypothetical protein ACRDVE_19260, partial [Actinocrinis sp.]